MKKRERWVVDTNVPISANGAPTDGKQVSLSCRLASVVFLEELLRSGLVLLDTAGHVQEEYRRHLHPSGQPGVGDMFYREVLNSHPDRIERVELPIGHDGEYVDLPRLLVECGFDPSDRKFAALAVRGAAKVANATDSDWINDAENLAKCSIVVEHLCGCSPGTWFAS